MSKTTTTAPSEPKTSETSKASQSSRRRFLKQVAAGIGAVTLSACRTSVPITQPVDPPVVTPPTPATPPAQPSVPMTPEIVKEGCTVNPTPLSYAQPLAQEVENAPNVLFIFTDDQGWGDAGSFGHPYLKTPNIDRLTTEGTWYKQFYVNSAVCSPSRAALMTGRYPNRSNVHWHYATPERNDLRCMANWLDNEIPTMADVFQKAGYATGQFGKWHLSHAMPEAPSPTTYGFDQERTYVSNKFGWQGTPGFLANSTDLFVEETIKFISDTTNESVQTGKRKPFFANLWTYVPHSPYRLRPSDIAEYESLVANPNDFPEYMANYMRKASDLTSQMRTYCAVVTSLDKAIGRLLDYLDAAQLTNDTLIVFASDNGPEDYAIPNAADGAMGSPGPYRGRKRSLYEGGIRTPLVLRWPGVIKNNTVNNTTTVTAVDFLPTLSKLAGIELPEGMNLDGEDLKDVVLGKKRQRMKDIFWEHRFDTWGDSIDSSPGLALRSGEWKFLMNPDGSQKQLYNLVDDVEERQNVMQDYGEIGAGLEQKLQDWYNSI